MWADVVGAGEPGVGDSEPHGGDAVGAAGVASGDAAEAPEWHRVMLWGELEWHEVMR